ncbi:hypothetical protein DPEC_G00021140 [Dallia pectoralis]|uniref:Uncharacterized protein n=1 Tax=Dallia pectoralis TaxID=75939 RepID=A0ACC2HGU1_DALPE|nr:hypothetical protein DPEC_G00021140 [Dallia pectoralis]
MANRNQMPCAQLKAVYVPRFGSQSSQRSVSQIYAPQIKEYHIELPTLKRTSFVPCPSYTDSPQSMLSEDIFNFSKRDKHKSTNEPQWTIRQSVLKTIDRMLQENRSIRGRLVSLSQSKQVVEFTRTED